MKPDLAAIAPQRAADRRGAIPLMPRAARQILTVVHVVTSVGLVGNVVAVLVLTAIGHAEVAPSLARAVGIPFLLVGLLSGILLGLGTRWGLFRHGWVTAKLVLQLLVLAIGAGAVRPGLEALGTGTAGPHTTAAVLSASSTQLAALLAATVLSVVKPRRLLPRRAPVPSREGQSS